MKKLISFLFCLLLLAALAVPALATTEPEEEVTASDEEILEWESFETIPIEETEGWEGAIKVIITEDGTFQLPVEENGAIQWSDGEDSTLTIGAITDGKAYIFGEFSEGYVQFDSGENTLGSSAQDTFMQPSTGSTSLLNVTIIIVCVIFLGLALLVFLATLLIILIVMLAKKNKKQSAKENETAI